MAIFRFAFTLSEREVITMTYASGYLLPEEVKLKQGKQYTIIIRPETTELGCMSSIFLSGLDEKLQMLKKGEEISFSVDAEKVGSYDFLCGMGLPFFSRVIVE
jgi:hypothetical protein